jgi:hypothetical protein
MAVRIQNMGKHQLALDLRSGETIYLDPHEISRPLREESLYTNPYLPQWLATGLVRRFEASMSEVLAFEEESEAPGEPEGAAEDSPEESAPSASRKTTKKSGSKGEQKTAQDERG